MKEEEEKKIIFLSQDVNVFFFLLEFAESRRKRSGRRSAALQHLGLIVFISSGEEASHPLVLKRILSFPALSVPSCFFTPVVNKNSKELEEAPR